MYSWVPASRIRKFGGSSMVAYLQRRADGQKADQGCSIDREENNDLPQTGAERRRSIGGALAGALVARHLLERGDWGFFGLEEGGGKESYGR